MPDPSGLAALEAALARDLVRLNHPPADWVPARAGPDGRPMADVAIVGAGMCGLAAAFALRRLGLNRIRHIDRGADGFEGPWLTYARMRTLRSPKHLTGPALDLPNLTFRAWWEAQHGAAAWEELGRIPRPVWMDYLRWYRRVTGAAVENRAETIALRPGTEGVALELRTAAAPAETVHARRVVLATGREGQARARVPAVLAPWLGSLVRHASDPIDFATLRGRRVAVIGLAASAFDNAGSALEAGAAQVTLIGRARALPRLNKMKHTVHPGFTHGFPALPDADKLRFLRHIMERRIAPPRESVQRVSADPRARLLLGAGLESVERAGDSLRLRTAAGRVTAELVILATGFAIDLAAPPELGAFEGQILRWRDRMPQAPDDEWMAFPCLGPGFEFCERRPGAVPGLGRIHCFTHAAQLSLGNLANDIPAVGEGARRLAEAIARALFVEDRARHWERLVAYDEPELMGDEWPGLAEWDPPPG
ncbi:MAG TPA: NAD(P)/FAD-dependent oxidoreductase [Thermohalobaculum sp.]|nr:NAD(P)/FAD-dependent oxidoreductase [Thermohalobaculum sp.]